MAEVADERQPPSSEGRRRRAGQGCGRLALGLALFVTLYVAGGWFGLGLVAVSGFATPVWAPSGLALTALLVLGRRVWPAVAASAFVVNLIAGAEFPLATAIATGNTLEAVVGASLLIRHGFVPTLARIRDVVLLVGFAAVGSTVVSPTIGSSALWLTDQLAPDAALITWVTWWIGDALGDLVVASLLLVWTCGRRARLWSGSALEATGLLAALALANAVVFTNILTSEQSAIFRQAYIVFPVLIWAAIRFRQHGTTLAAFLTSAAAIAATSLGRGPFAGGSLEESLLLLQVFMGVVAVTMLILAAAVSERDDAIEARAAALAAQTDARRRAEAAEERAGFLDRAGRVLASSLNYRDTLQQMAELAVPALADMCRVELLEADGSVVQAAVAHRDPEALERARELRRRFPPDPAAERGVGYVIRTGRADFSPALDGDGAPAPDSDRSGRALSDGLGLESSMIVPLLARERVLGALCWATAGSGRRYTEADLQLAQELARRAAVAVDNSRLFEEAQHAIHAREQFLSIASHELRTPLTALTLQVQSLLRARRDPSKAPLLQNKLAAVERQVIRLTTLVDNLLDVSRVMSGRMVLDFERFDLRRLVEEVVERFSEPLEDSGSTLALELAPSCEGSWDRFRVEQIVTNLLANAVKYGGGKPIALRLFSEPGQARLVVSDRGIGIAAEDQARIFERFERAVSHRNFGGLGLGLWITKELVVALGGAISLESAAGQGAEFTVFLPKEPAEPLRPSESA